MTRMFFDFRMVADSEELSRRQTEAEETEEDDDDEREEDDDEGFEEVVRQEPSQQVKKLVRQLSSQLSQFAESFIILSSEVE